MENKLRILADKLVFKFQTPSQSDIGEMKYLLGDISVDEFKGFILDLNRAKYLEFGKRFKKFKRDSDYNTSVLINWDRVFSDGLLKDTMIYDFSQKNPTAFDITTKKTRYLVNIDSMGYKEPSLGLYSLDQLMMGYFTDMERYNNQFQVGATPKVEDVYSNIRFFVAVTGLDDRGVFSIDSYEKLLKDFDITVDENISKALKEKAEKSLKNNEEKIRFLNLEMKVKTK